MPLSIGARLGPFEIAGFVGGGGMGEVYRAHDSRLGRDVAVKVLPATFSSDPERLRRFEQEARAAAALNHPNILAVHDIGQHDGSPYIVSELLNGETLRERLQDGTLPVRKAVEYAVQICHGLAAAHEKGITHRDLKPENVFLTTDGHLKILDFGLAKLTQPEVAAAGTSALPTTPPNTQAGMVLGTIGYMAPEQVRGQEADHRSDIFAIGAVMHEMLSGQRAFGRQTPADTILAILKEDPPELATAERPIPVALARLVGRCLEKQPAARFQSTRDLAFALEGVSAHSDTAVTAPALAARWSVLTPTRLATVVTGALLVGFLVGLGSGTIIDFPSGETDTPLFRSTILLPEGAAPSATPGRVMALSPDGQRLAFAFAEVDGRQQLWVRPLDGLTAQPLAGTENASTPFWSPDAEWIGFFADGKLKKVRAAGGPVQTLCDCSGAGGGGSWSRDDVILFADDGGAGAAIHRVSASGGTPTAVVAPDSGSNDEYGWPSFLPDGRHFLFRSASVRESGIYVGSLDSPERTLLLRGGSNARYAQGHLLFLQEGTLMAQPFDVALLALQSEAVPLAEQVAFAVSGATTGVSGAFSVSETGALVYISDASSRQLVWFDRSGKPIGTLGAPDTSQLYSPRLAPDGVRAAVIRYVQGNFDIWLVDATRTTRLTFDAGGDRIAVWSPDGSRVVFDSLRKNVRDLYLLTTSRPGTEELLLESAQDKIAQDWSRDGRFLLYTAVDGQQPPSLDLWVMPMEGKRTPYVFLQTSFNERRGQFSPDGRWVAYQSNQSGRDEIYVRPFSASSGPASGSQSQVSTAGGISPRWSADGHIYYLAPDGTLMAAPATTNGATFEAGTPVILFQTRIVGGGTETDQGTQYDVSSDGRLLVNTADDTRSLTLVQNWTAAVQK